MATELSPKTEHRRIMGLLLGYAHRNVQKSEPPQGSDSLIVYLHTIRQQGGPEPAEIRELFVAESVMAEGGFTMRYDPERDRVHFNRTKQLPASSPAQVAAQPAPIDAAQPNQKPEPINAERATAIAVQEWATDSRLHAEFTSQAAFVAFRRAELAGRVRIIGKRQRVQ